MTSNKPINQITHRAHDSESLLLQDVYIGTLCAAFLLDCKTRNLTKHTQRFYRVNLETFMNFCDKHAVKTITQITADFLRLFFLHLEENGNNPGGRHVYYRTIRVFLRWYVNEFDVLEWRDPLRKVKPPKVDIEPQEPIKLEVIKAMIETCKRGKFTDERDRSILLFLLDTGVRAGELLELDRQDVNLISGDVLIRKSKSRKPRTVFLGRKARQALRNYLKLRDDVLRALYLNDNTERLKMAGLRQIMVRRARKAGVPIPPLHSFRRAFAVAMIKAGVDLLTISRLLGHSDLSLLNRYIKQDNNDLREQHSNGSPGDAL